MDLRWNSDTVVCGGAEERTFRVGDIPGVLWLPSQLSEAVPLVLIGHGGSGDKRSPRVVRLAQWFASTAGVAVLAIDGPFHGDRAVSAYQERVAEVGVGFVSDAMVQDWLRTISAVGEASAVDTGALGYVGFSMGTRFGLPLVALLGPRVKAAVLGKYGLRDGGVLNRALHDPASSIAAAGQIRCPVLFHVEWGDQVFPRTGQFELFDQFASTDKSLWARNGQHETLRESDEIVWRTFVADRLRP